MTRLTSFELLEDRIQPSGGGFANAGIRGDYYANDALSGTPAFSRFDNRIDFDWGSARQPGGSSSPAYASVGTDAYSIRWNGTVIPKFTETYTFELAANDGARLFIRPEGAANFTTLIDQWNTSGTFTANFAFTANSRYDIRVEYRELTGAANVRLRWQSPSTPLEVIESPSAQGYNLSGREIFLFADVLKTARPTWGGVYGGPAPATDANGWPTSDGELLLWEGAFDPYFSGTYRARFTGQANVGGWPGGGNGITYRIPGNPTVFYSLTAAQIWDSNTNTSTFEIVVPAYGPSPYGFQVTNTRRLPTDTTATGITNLEIMRPRTIGGNDPYAFGTLYREDFKTAASVFTHFRWLDTNGDLSEREWNQRITPAWSRATSPAQAGVVNKQWTYEYQIQFANETGKDLYLTLPMRASNDYLLQLARLLRYGSRADGTACTSDNDPLRAYAGLNPNLKVYLEVANEVWNAAGGFEQTRQADDDAVAAGLAPAGSPLRAEWDIINYDNTLNTNDYGGTYSFDMARLARWYALRTIRMSEVFRTVYGDSMLDTARPVFYWQYNNGNNTAFSELKFLDDYFNNSAGNFVANPHPVNYYVWGAGGASYYGSGNPQGQLAVDPITNASFDITQGLPLNTATVRPNSVTGWNFAGNAGVVGRAPAAPATFTSEGRSLIGVPNPSTGDFSAYLVRNTTGSPASTVSRTIHISEPGRYAIGFTLRYRSGWQYNVPLDFFLDGARVTPQYLPYRGVGEASPANGPSTIAYSWNIDAAAFWTSQLTTATLQIDVPAGGRDVTFAVQAANVTAVPTDWDYQYQLEAYALFDNFYVASVDRIFTGGIPNTGEALGQSAVGAWTDDRQEIAEYAQSYGLVPASYEAGWSLGGDSGASPLQNWAKYRDPRAATANNTAIDVHNQSGYGLVSWGVYEQWRDYELATATSSQLWQSFNAKNQSLPVEVSNGLNVPLSIRPEQQSLGYTGSGTSWAFTRTADRTLSAGEYLAWNILVPAAGQYSINPVTTGTGTMRLTLDEELLTTSGAVTRFLTPGLYSLKLRSTNGSILVDRVDVSQINAPPAPTLLTAADQDSRVSLQWTSVPGATSYAIRIGSSPNNYSTNLNAGSATSFTVTGLTNNQSYYFAVVALNANGQSLPSNERSATPLGEGQTGTLANWEFTGFAGNQPNAPASTSTSRVIVSPITRGNGMTPSGDWVLQYFPNRFSSFAANNTWAQSLPAAITANQYYQFTIAPGAGQSLSLEQLHFSAWFSNATASCNVGVRMSSDGTNFTDLAATGAINTEAGFTVNPNISNTIGTVTFRVYFFGLASYNATGIGMGTAANDLTVTGRVQSIPAVVSTAINDGQLQRSRINSLSVTFNTLVTLGANAFELRPQAGGTAVPIQWTSSDVNGQTIATITIPTPLSDGRWRLTTIASNVTHRQGGVTMAANHSFDFHRLFGDADGNATIDSSDLGIFGSQFGATGPNNFDSDGNNSVDSSDFAAFGANFGFSL